MTEQRWDVRTVMVPPGEERLIGLRDFGRSDYEFIKVLSPQTEPAIDWHWLPEPGHLFLGVIVAAAAFLATGEWFAAVTVPILVVLFICALYARA